MTLLSEAVKKEIEEIVKSTNEKVTKEEVQEIVNEIVPRLEALVKKEVTKYFKHLASLILYSGVFKEDS